MLTLISTTLKKSLKSTTHKICVPCDTSFPIFIFPFHWEPFFLSFQRNVVSCKLFQVRHSSSFSLVWLKLVIPFLLIERFCYFLFISSFFLVRRPVEVPLWSFGTSILLIMIKLFGYSKVGLGNLMMYWLLLLFFLLSCCLSATHWHCYFSWSNYSLDIKIGRDSRLLEN